MPTRMVGSSSSAQQQSLSKFFGSKRTKSSRNVDRVKRLRTAPTKNKSRFGRCPLCQQELPYHHLIPHAELCQGVKAEETKCVRERNHTGKTIKSLPPCADQPTTARVSTDDDGSSSGALWWKKVPPQKPVIHDPIQHTDEPIPGLFLYENFLSPAEEGAILRSLDASRDWRLSRFNGKSFGQRWGVHCNLRDRRVGAAERPMPSFYSEILLPKLRRLLPMMGCTPNEANAIEYRVKDEHYLADHVDDRQLSKEPIANLSLAGDCYMTFINQKKSVGNNTPHRVLLRRCTLQVLTGRARYDYSHGIRNHDLLSERRISITMRESPLTTIPTKGL